MSQIVFGSRDDLIAALEGRRSWAERYDRDTERANERARQEYWSENKRRMREALRWSTDEAEQHGYEPNFSVGRNGRRYPRGENANAVERLDAALSILAATQQQSFKISADNGWSTLFWLLTGQR